MLERTILDQILLSIEHFPVTILSGPRQTGKSTLLFNKLVEKGYSYITLDNRTDYMDALNDPKEFLSRLDYPVIIDECQRAKELFVEIEAIVNEVKLKKGSKKVNGMFVLSGSSSKALMENAKESMAGRCNILRMNPLSLREIYGYKDSPFIVDKKISRDRAKDYQLNEKTVLRHVLTGGMPQLYDDPKTPRDSFFSSYVETYMEKDLVEIMEIRNHKQFNDFLSLLASNTGQELIYDNYAKLVGVKSPTIKQWVSALEKTGIIWLSYPYNEESFVKQIVKRPKLYFFDTGFACFLAGIKDIDTLSSSFMKGRMIETLIANEIRKSYLNCGINQTINYYRDTQANEIDLIILKDGRLMMIECKAGIKYNENDVLSFKKLDTSKFNIKENCIICTSKEAYSISDNVIVLPISSI